MKANLVLDRGIPAPTMYIDPSLARGLAKQHLSDWKVQGLLLRKQLSLIIFDAQQALKKGRSPSKAVGQAQAQLRSFFNHNPVAGVVGESHGRELAFSLICPEPMGDDLVLLNIVGSMNSRTGGIEIKVHRTVSISLHALERLHQRIGSVDSYEVITEIHSVIRMSKTFINEGRRVGAHCWPLISTRGVFVTASAEDGITSTLITWMPFDQLSKKWGFVVDQLQEAFIKRPNWFNDDEFCGEFIRSFPWMLQPHRPSPDMEAVAWESSGQESDQPLDLPVEHEVKAFANEQVFNEEISDQSGNFDNLAPRSIDLRPGFNYLIGPPPFSMHSRFSGIVVQSKLRSGSAIVSLLNGWVGQIPCQGLDRANAIEDGLGNIVIGDRIVVEVMKIRQTSDGTAWRISLDLAAKADHDWREIEARNPIASLVEGTVMRATDHAYYLRLGNGTAAELLKNELSWTKGISPEENTIAVGQVLECVVTGSKPKNRLLTVSHRRTKADPFSDPAFELEVGSVFKGTVCKVSSNGAHIRLPIGIDGWIFKPNFHGVEAPSVGDIVNVEVIQVDKEKRRVSLIFQGTGENLHHLLPMVQSTEDSWQQTMLNYSAGSIVAGQINRFFENSTLLAFPDGAVGFLHDKELTWDRSVSLFKASLKVGQQIELKVIGFNSAKRTMEVSRRQCTTHPFDDPALCPSVGQSYRGTVSKVVDFGLFLRVTDGIEGLLHKSSMPGGQGYQVGQVLDVIVIDVQLNKRRMAFGLASS